MLRGRLVVLLFIATSLSGQVLSGRWDGKILYGKLAIPFTLFFEGSGSKIIGSFINGDARVSSTAGSLEGNALRLEFASLGTYLEASLADGGLQGKYGDEKSGFKEITAGAYCTCSYEGEAGPDIMGDWEVTDAGARLKIRRKEQDTLVTITHRDRTVGPVTGRFDGLSFTLHYFDGVRAALLEIEPGKNDDLDLAWTEPGETVKKQKAVRVKVAP